MIVTKVIRPKPLKVDAIRLELLNEMRKVATQIKKDFQATTATWDHKPKFEQIISLIPKGPELMVATDDEIYAYVDKGTGLYGPKHAKYRIPKQGTGLLAFPSGYVAKTVPNVIGSKAGGSYGDTIVVKGPIWHPGIKPRNFDKLIQKKWDKPFKRSMEAAMKRGAQKSGHGV